MEKKRQDIRLNKDYRTAYIKDFRRFLESNKENPKYESYLSAKTLCKTRIDDAFKLATKVVHRVYKPEDVSTLQTLQKKYNTVDATAEDSCFYFANTEIETTENERDNNEHVDFKLDANLSGRFSQSDFALAYFRDELKSAGLNPESILTFLVVDKDGDPPVDRRFQITI